MRTHKKIINLYEDKDLFSIKKVISINSEEDLNQFWDYLSNSSNPIHGLIHNFTTKFYNFALSYMSREDAEFFEIILEENEDCFYFTLWNKKIALLFENYLEKTSIEFLCQKSRISIKLTKEKFQDDLEILHKQDKKREKILIKSVTKPDKVKRIERYTFIGDDDLDELMNLNEDLQDLMYQTKRLGLNIEVFISLRSAFSLFCLTLRYYDEIGPMSTTITEFSNLMNTNTEKFISLNDLELELINGFISNIGTWLHTLFIDGGAHINFMNHSIESDLQTISMLIKDEEIEEDTDIDDIFDF